jgi:hypothetical protein
MSFLEEMNINQMVIDAEIQGISEHLFQEWMDSNLDEGTFWADYQFAVMCDSKQIKQAFNEFYKMEPEEQYYVEVPE